MSYLLLGSLAAEASVVWTGRVSTTKVTWHRSPPPCPHPRCFDGRSFSSTSAKATWIETAAGRASALKHRGKESPEAPGCATWGRHPILST